MRFFLPGACLCLALAFCAACGPDGGQGQDAWQRPEGQPPAYHRPVPRWRALHGGLVRFEAPGRADAHTSRALAWFEVGECLLCHRPEDSCNACHGFAGAALLPRSACLAGEKGRAKP